MYKGCLRMMSPPEIMAFLHHFLGKRIQVLVSRMCLRSRALLTSPQSMYIDSEDMQYYSNIAVVSSLYSDVLLLGGWWEKVCNQ